MCKNVRWQVEWFSEKMENVLQENDHKGGWNNCNISWLYKRLLEEVGELGEALIEDKSVDRIRKEAVDIANFAMMIADNS